MGNKPVFDISKTTIPFAQEWTKESYGAGNWIFTHPNNLGSILFNSEHQIVMVLSTRSEPRADKIREGIAFQLKYGDPDQDILERFLEAEMNALSNNRRPDTHFQHWPLLFEYIHNPANKWFAIVECGTDHSHGWVAVTDEELKKLTDAAATLLAEVKTSLDVKRAMNTIKMVTSIEHCNFRVLLVKSEAVWRQVLVEDNEEQADFGIEKPNNLGITILNAKCSCGYNHTAFYDDIDLGDRAKAFEELWSVHRRQHPKCTNRVLSITQS